MGACSSTAEDGEARSKSAEIDAQLKKDKMRMENEVKLLLLGAGESGKSTIVKQMKIIHQDGYSKEECEAFKDVIFSNTLQSMKVLVNACQKLEIEIEAENQEIAEEIALLPATGEAFNQHVGKNIGQLWKSKAIQEAYDKRAAFQLNDSALYYFDAIERISTPDYVPTQQDVLRSRVRTTGIVETQFSFGGLRFRMFDVGGQRNERKKWIHCFQGVTAVVFVVGISEYDQVLYEDETQNRMKESLLLFDEICNSRWFTETSMILFLNKMDLFKEKIIKVDLACCFPDYTGGLSYDNASKYIQARFIELNKSEEKQVYPHFTCATDTENVKFVFEAVKDVILQANLRSSGFV